MTKMLHSEHNYDTASLKRAIKRGDAVPTTRNHSQMTTFPLPLPQTTRTALANLSQETGESMASIIRQAIGRILDQGACGVEHVTSRKRALITSRRASQAQEKADRALGRALDRQEQQEEKAHVRAIQADVKAIQDMVQAEKAERASRRVRELEVAQAVQVAEWAEKAAQKAAVTVLVPTQPESSLHLEEPTTTEIVVPVQLDRPAPPTPQHTWVNGGTNRWGGYWRAPRASKIVTVREPGCDDNLNG